MVNIVTTIFAIFNSPEQLPNSSFFLCHLLLVKTLKTSPRKEKKILFYFPTHKTTQMDKNNSILFADWLIFVVLPGFWIIKNPFTVEEQLRWVEQCLFEYTKQPNISNFNSTYGFVDVPALVSSVYGPTNNNNNNKPSNHSSGKNEDWSQDDEIVPLKKKLKGGTTTLTKNRLDDLCDDKLLKKLRWVTLGIARDF